MSKTNCRFCYSSTTLVTSSIHDDAVRKFIDFIPQLDITANPLFPSSICQLCYGKAKISSDFIEKILDVQQKFQAECRSSRKTQSATKTSSQTLSSSEALERVKKVGGISIRKVSAINQSVDECPTKEDDDLMDEIIDDGDDLFEAAGSSDEDYNVSKDESEYDEDFIEEDDLSDENFEPAAKKKKKSGKESNSGSPKKNKAPTVRRTAANENREIIIDAPIAFSCAKCHDKFQSFDALTDHMKSRICQSEKSICKVCNRQFLTKKSLYNHMVTHRVKQKFICEHCAKEYNHQFDLETHMESAHQRAVKRNCIYRCTHCPDQFQSQLELLEHVKEHQREKKEAPRLCEICAKVCANLKAYQSHLVIHKEKKAHTCGVCGKGFCKLFLYQQHMHVHTGIKAFTCDICSKSYAKRDSLRVHKKRDHPETV